LTSRPPKVQGTQSLTHCMNGSGCIVSEAVSVGLNAISVQMAQNWQKGRNRSQECMCYICPTLSPKQRISYHDHQLVCWTSPRPICFTILRGLSAQGPHSTLCTFSVVGPCSEINLANNLIQSSFYEETLLKIFLLHNACFV